MTQEVDKLDIFIISVDAFCFFFLIILSSGEGGAVPHMRLCGYKEKQSLNMYTFITLSYCIPRGGDMQAVSPFTFLKERRSLDPVFATSMLGTHTQSEWMDSVNQMLHF